MSPPKLEKQEKIPAVVVVLGVVVGAISGFAVASLHPSPSLFAALVGGVCGGGAVDLHESIFKDIGWAHAAVLYAFYISILSLGPFEWEDDPDVLAFLWFLGNVLLPAVIGGFAGGLVSKLWKALVR